MEVPPEMTQDGLAAASWVELRHLSQYLRPLLEEELVQERTTHVKGIRMRRKVYDLTEAGQHAAYRLRDRVRAETVRVRDAQGVREEPIAKVLEAAGGEVPLLELVRRSMQTGVIDLDALAAKPTSALVEMVMEAPRLDRFVGRTAELETITRAGEGPRIIVVRGVAGIGKSSLAAKACETLRGRCNLYWHTVRPWDTRTSILANLGEFLYALGKPGLRAVVSRGEAGQAADVLREELPGSRAFLIFDDAHEASPEVLALFRFLKDAAADAPDLQALFLARRTPPFYDRRDVSLRRLVKEIDLTGLSPEEIVAFLAPERDTAAGNLGLQLGGHPLFLQLVRSAGAGKIHGRARQDMDRFLEEEVYEDLSETERKALKIAALYRVPVPREALLADPSVSHETILSLVNRSLLRPVGTEALEVHDAVRSFLVGMLTPTEREALGLFASGQLKSLARHAQEAGDLIACVNYLSNCLQLLPSGDARVEVWEALGDVEEGLGDLPAALTAYKEAMRAGHDPVRVARLHRKTAMAFLSRGNAQAASEETVRGARALGDVPSVERGWLDLARSRVSGGSERWSEARDQGRQALATFHEFQDPRGRASTLVHLASMEIEGPSGDLSQSEAWLREALDLSNSLHETDLMGKAHTMLAYLFAYRTGNAEAAMEHLGAVEALSDSIRDPHLRRSVLMLKGWFHIELLGDCSAAESYFRDALVLSRRIHDASAMTGAGYGLGFCDYFSGNVQEARDAFEDLGPRFLELGNGAFAVESLWMEAECSLRLGELARFRKAAASLEAPSLADARKARPVHASVLRGVNCFLGGDREGWRRAFRDALQIVDRQEALEEPATLCILHSLYGLTLREVGEDSEAAEHLRTVAELLGAYHLKARERVRSQAERELAVTLARAVGSPEA